ncbi:hypothetical protein POSPLADRAFT_1138127 [Postia placenta MAD-698-R-SB12]|uniref:Uncharacterized protein n=1 Tax=Postia placenta MAD-698-R-SB12 TaxID=670580 RepID=A0A1X6N637_9APHY|nr:hypothetical protein POSPLADRAFT_1138127 [Postia placenta MAD-698-R-SB12]OSX63980.1 hypothetical protein POSPLADRAFT_1138127 [Postia placenta MAD-698-R-SB12]
MSEAQAERQPLLHANDAEATEVYPVIQMIRAHYIGMGYTPFCASLTAPDLTYTLVRPLEEKYNALQRRGNMSIVFCLLLNRVYFKRDDHLTTAALSRTRAMLCEILAIRTLRQHAHNMLELALAITTSWPVYSGAPEELLQRAREERDDDLEDRVGNAIELAILGQAKRFTNSSACQKVIDGIWWHLFLTTTVLVSILSNTFATINDDATAEAMFRRAVLTIEGVKADPLFSYQPPINLVALCIMLPASYILSPRWFHKVSSVFCRLTSFPTLLLIAWYERQAKRSGAFTFSETISAAADKIFDTLPRSLKRLTFFEGLSGPDADIDAIFELEDAYDESALDEEDSEQTVPMENSRQRRLSQMSRRQTSQASGPTTPPRSSVKAEQLSSSSSVPLPRTRVNSTFMRGLELAHNVSSPLAQVFQPLVVGDDHQDEQSSDHNNALVSYGPATRRRLSSMVRRPTAPPADPFGGPSQPQPIGARRIPTGVSPSKRSGVLNASLLSESPDAKSGSEHMATMEETEESIGMSALARRLDGIEQQQKRIEDLLLRLANRG